MLLGLFHVMCYLQHNIKVINWYKYKLLKYQQAEFLIRILQIIEPTESILCPSRHKLAGQQQYDISWHFGRVRFPAF